MDQDILDRRAAAVAELKAALAELESDEGLVRFVGGHGLQSRVFEFQWSDPALELDFRLPYARVLSGEEAMKSDDEEIRAAIKMAMLLMMVDMESNGIGRIRVARDDRGASYRIYAQDGSLQESGEDWGAILYILDGQFIGDDIASKEIYLP